jgi:hypothetical protein
VQPWAFRSQVRSSLRPRRDTGTNATAPGLSVPVACLGPRAFQPRVPSVGLTSPCGQVSRARPTVRKNVSRLGHHLRCRRVTRLVKVMGRHRQLFRARPRCFHRPGSVSLRGKVAPEQDASHQPLQPTSVVTSTHWGPNSQARDSRRLARRALPDLPADAGARAAKPNRPRRCRIAVSGISDPGW